MDSPYMEGYQGAERLMIDAVVREINRELLVQYCTTRLVVYLNFCMGFQGARRKGVKTTREPGAGWEKV